jgi:regulator of sigma E protease
MTILLGIVCLSILILIHELGHFAAARCAGVAVESFSLGMGPVILHQSWHGTDYRLSLLPLGGYCGMKGEKDYQEAVDLNRAAISGSADSFYGVHPLKRVAIAAAGPLSNLGFAITAFALIAFLGYTYYSADNRIILADELYPDLSVPARVAGLQTGDRILTIDGAATNSFLDISREVSPRPGEALNVTAERGGRILEFVVVPVSDQETLGGKIGVVNWVEPVVAEVMSGSPAEKAGLKPGDSIVAVDGLAIQNTVDLQAGMAGKESSRITFRRGSEREESADVVFIEPTERLGLGFAVPPRQSPK